MQDVEQAVQMIQMRVGVEYGTQARCSIVAQGRCQQGLAGVKTAGCAATAIQQQTYCSWAVDTYGLALPHIKNIHPNAVLHTLDKAQTGAKAEQDKTSQQQFAAATPVVMAGKTAGKSAGQ